MKLGRVNCLCSFLVIAMMLVPAVPANSDGDRATSAVRHISTFGDGSASAMIDFAQAGTDDNLYITIPNGAKVLSASIDISGNPYVDGGIDYPEGVTMDVDGQSPPEYEFNSTWYSSMGDQTFFSNGAPLLNVSLPSGGGTNASAYIRLPKKATVISAEMEISNPRGEKALKVAIETKPGSTAMDVVDNDPVYSIRDLCQAQDWTADIVGGSSLDTYEEIFKYDVVLTGDSGHSDNDWSTWAWVLPYYVESGGGFVGVAWIAYYSYSSVYPIDTVLPVECGGSGYEMPTGNMKVLTQTHPVTSNVDDFPVYSRVEYPRYGVDPDTTTLVNTPANRPGVVCWDKGLGRSVWIGPIGFGNFQSYGNKPYYSNTDFRNLMANAIRWSAGYGPVNCSLDITNDGSVEFSNQLFTGSATIPDAAAQINAYLAQASPDGTDLYGNQYVDVPLALSSDMSGMIQLSNLNVTYQYTATVGPNPAGDLAQALNAALPNDFDGKSTDIHLSVYSAHSGKLNLSGISIDYQPPEYNPVIDTQSPADNVVEMNENETKQFTIAASDRFGFPLTVTWHLDGEQYMEGSYSWEWYADFDANGTHDVTATVANDVASASTSWTVTVKNVNRLPVIDAFSPSQDFLMDENDSATFEISASDPDAEPLSYTWFLDGAPTGEKVPAYTYSADYASAGKHEVKVNVSDTLGGTTPLVWTVTVSDSNVAPSITGWSPVGDVVVMNEMDVRDFAVHDVSVDKDSHTYRWLLDGNTTGAMGNGYSYVTDYNSSGQHMIEVEVSDGEVSVNKTWRVTVNDVNRPPVALIDSPLPAAEFMEGDAVLLSGASSWDPDGDALSLSWREGAVSLGTGTQLTLNPARGTHIIMLVANDGKANGETIAQTVITVRYVQFSGYISIPPREIVEHNTVAVSVFLINKGDGSATNVSVSFNVDGEVLMNRNLERVTAGGEYTLEFQWKAVRGDHTLSAEVMNQTISRSVTASRSAAAQSESASQSWLTGALLVVIILMGVALGVLTLRGRRKPAVADGAPAAVMQSPLMAQPPPITQPAPQYSPAPQGTVPQPSLQPVPPPQPQPYQSQAQPPPPQPPKT